MKKYLIAGLITIAVIVGIVFLVKSKDSNSFATNEEYFIAIVETALKEEYGNLAGYEPGMIIKTFSGVTNADFEGVQTGFGAYEIIDGGIAFRPAPGESFTESKTYISAEGMKTLLNNLSTRFGIEVTDQASVEDILRNVYNK